ncbi:MAG TPA: oligopeptide:H+ symporter [Chiayiivirga sp.]|nr:MAG: MFS transporter [Gammaproteobacteria bacterium]HPA01124.1 oligopeptide:H+ symporter [Chiayiivirga sp.]
MNTSPVAASKARSFSTVFLIEMWERFGYYGMQALIIYYMVQRLGFSDTRANLTWSAAAALIYVAPAIGGWIGDKVLGTRRTMLIGAVVLAVGYALMVVPSEDVSFLFLALGVIVVGNGLFKANAGNLVRKIYEGDDSRIDSAFTMYYMAVNLGSMFSMLLTPWIKDYVNEHYGNELGWHVAFAVCCVGLAVGLANYFVMRQTMRHIGSEPDHHPLHWGKLGLVALGGGVTVIGAAYVLDHAGVARAFVYLAGLIVAGIFAYLIAAGKRHERPGLAAAVILTVQTMFFFIFYQQMSTSLNLFALRNVDWSFSVFGAHLWTWSPAQFQAFNPIWIFILSPALAWFYTKAGRSGKDLPIAAKFALGFAAVAAGFFIYGVADHFTTEPGKTSSWIMVWGYGAAALGELLVSGLGLAMVARYVPSRMGGFLMGAYFVAVGISMYLGGFVANFASVPEELTDPVLTMPIYTNLFLKLGMAGMACTVVALACLPVMRRLTAAHHAQASSTAQG